MSFEWPLALLGLIAVPLTAGLYMLSQRRRRAYAVRFTNLELLGSVVTASPGWRRHLPPLLFLLALTALTVAIARPHVNVDVAKEEATVMLTLDSSGSMQATDVTPNRLDAARSAAKGFTEPAAGEVPARPREFQQRGAALGAAHPGPPARPERARLPPGRGGNGDRHRARDVAVGVAAGDREEQEGDRAAGTEPAAPHHPR